MCAPCKLALAQQFKLLFLIVGSIMATSCTRGSETAAKTSGQSLRNDPEQHVGQILQRDFGVLPSGEAVTLLELTNSTGAKIQLSSLGAAILSAYVPDRNGHLENVVLGYDSLDGYRNDSSFFGYTVGRFANRLGGATFSIDGKRYTVDQNEGSNALHGGRGGFHSKNWRAEVLDRATTPAVRFSLESAAGDQGFPGMLVATTTYSLLADNTLTIDFTASSDAPTVVNMTNHAYFNLGGAGSGDILSHTLQLQADSFTATNEQLIPTGEILPVAGGYLDFTKPLAVGARRALWPEKLLGYDHNFVVHGTPGTLRRAATLIDPATGRSLEVHTTAAGIQVYSGIHLKNIAGRDGRTYQQYGGICLEAQNFPDAPNHPHFPSAIVRPGRPYSESIHYRFGIAAPQ
jgi:aldose 1-epimerase